jgi:ribonuclease G
MRVLRDLLGEDVERVRSTRLLPRGDDRLYAHFQRAGRRIELFDGKRPIFDLYGVEVNRARSIAKPEIGRLPDVRPDRGADHGRREHRRLRRPQPEDTAITNLRPRSRSRQLRPRNIGGIIIVDFIDMQAEHAAACYRR